LNYFLLLALFLTEPLQHGHLTPEIFMNLTHPHYLLTEWLSVIAVEIVEHQLDVYFDIAVENVADQDQHHTF